LQQLCVKDKTDVQDGHHNSHLAVYIAYKCKCIGLRRAHNTYRHTSSLGYTSEILCHRRTWLRDILFLNNALRKHDYIHNHTVGKKTCLKTLAESSQLFSRIRFESKQEAQLSQRDRAMLRVIEYFAKSLKGHSRSFEMTLSRRE